MSVGIVLYNALQSLVSGRVYPGEFPQEPELPTWPAIRYAVISEDVFASLGGSEDDTADDVRVQIDIVDKSYDGMRALKRQVIAALASTDPPAVRQDGGFDTVDPDTGTHRAVIEYVFQPSSVEGSPW